MTTLVAAAKVPEVAPAGMVIAAGTVTIGLLAERATARPPAGAVPDSVMVQAADEPPLTEAGAHCREESAGAWTVTDAMRIAPP